MVGRIVRDVQGHIGFAWCEAVESGQAHLRYIDLPGVREEVRKVPIGRVRLAKLDHGARVWVRSTTFGWMAGEVAGHLSHGRYLVRLPAVSGDIALEERHLLVRWNQPLADPVGAVAHGFCDSPEYYEARYRFLDQLVHQRGVARGFTAALSAPIALYQHQLDTAARVLADPVPRYLLADEVGLGKTIEAGLVIRQMLLDDPEATVLVSAPAELTSQWEEELHDRFLLGEEIDEGRLQLASHEQLADDPSLGQLALVVVDEAHRMVDLLDRTPALRQNLLQSRALLLLSATPMRRNYATFLDLLNLIDPVAFPRNDIKGFRERVEQREREATGLQLLSSPRTARRHRLSVLNNLELLHGTDPTVLRLVQECRSEQDGASPLWSDLVNYVRETYRVSRRMIRHRRNTPATEEYPVAGRRTVFVRLDDPARPIVDTFLERYQEHLGGRDSRSLYARAVLNGLGGPRVLLRHLQLRLAASAGSHDFVPPHDRPLLKTAVARLQLVNTSVRLRSSLEVVQDRLDQDLKVVVVGTSPDTAREFYQHATARWPGRVGRHFGGAGQSDHEEVVWDFLSAPGGQVLVGDQSLEEGRNLQDAHVLVNLDLPLDPNRLEQRIGRLDRYSQRPGAAEIVVFAEPDSDWVSSHLRLLTDGIGIFAQSAATLQHRLAELLDELSQRLQHSGRHAFEFDLDELRANLEEEREEVDLLEEVEAGALTSHFDQAAVVELREAERNVTALREAFSRLVGRRGGVGIRSYEDPDKGLLHFGPEIHGLPADAVEQLRPLLKRPRAYGRDASIARRGAAPLRLGDPLVDWLARYLQRDERGRAHAFVRSCSAVEVPTLWLHCDFLVEFDASHAQVTSEAERRRLRRRADALLPPAIVRNWTSASGPAPGSLVRDVLGLPFSPGSDQVLRGELWEQVLSALPDWQQLCQMAGEAAQDLLRTSPALASAPAAAAKRAQAEVGARLSVLRARSERLGSAAERLSAQLDLNREEAIGQALVRGVSTPAVQMTACGGIVLWPAS
ncbi:protein DpdE [Micromonospora coerulea]|uniref:protein DpdE n=1 Tax=Micromonospora coerulea TaxID=47856 RepID=UPI001908D25F|nr:protein DpdE [Micromonospora veneta]